MAADSSPPQPTAIQKLATAMYPSFAMLAGMQLDVFTPLKDSPMTADQLADTLGVKAEKLSRLRILKRLSVSLSPRETVSSPLTSLPQ
jgi:hypothetical protein